MCRAAQPEEARKRMAETAARGRGGVVGPLQPFASGSQGGKEESLGQKLIEGVMADGKRVTTTLAAGAIGNQAPITVTSEQWFSPDLEILVMTRHSDPRSGETSYTLTNIIRAEPQAGLFDLPSDYTIVGSGYMRYPAGNAESRLTQARALPRANPVLRVGREPRNNLQLQ